jgi:hypothetical protein
VQRKVEPLVAKCFADLLFYSSPFDGKRRYAGHFLSLLLCCVLFKTSSSLRPRLPFVLITLLQSILSVVQMPEAGRKIIYGIVIIATLLLDGWERIEQ